MDKKSKTLKPDPKQYSSQQQYLNADLTFEDSPKRESPSKKKVDLNRSDVEYRVRDKEI